MYIQWPAWLNPREKKKEKKLKKKEYGKTLTQSYETKNFQGCH